MAESNTGMPTFQFRPTAVMGGRVGASGASPMLGLSGGDQQVAGVVRHADTTDLGAGSSLPQFLEEAFAPKINAVKQQKFYAGFTAARAGKTAADIHAEQPWYANIFGSTSYELGAETFAVQKSAADLENEFVQRMPELRKMTPEQIGLELNGMAANLMTGNLYTDAVIQKSFMERAGPMMQTHMEARTLWQQEELAKGQNQMWLSGAGALQTAFVNDATRGTEHPMQTLTPEQKVERSRMFLDMFQMPEGQNPESYLSNMMTTVEQMASEGQWHAVQTLEDSGLFNALPPDQRAAFDKRLDSARVASKAKAAENPRIYEPLVQLTIAEREGRVSARQAIAARQELDATYSAITGDKEGFFDGLDYAQGGITAMSAVFTAWDKKLAATNAAQSAADTAAAKELAKAQHAAGLAQAASTGAAGTVLVTGQATREEVDMAFDALLNTSIPKDSGVWAPADLGRVTVTNFSTAVSGGDPYVSERVKKRLAGMVEQSAGVGWTPAFEVAAQNWRNIRWHEIDLGNDKKDTLSGTSTAIAYFGEDTHNKFMLYDDLRQAQVPADQAYLQSFGAESLYAPARLSGPGAGQQREELQAYVDDLNPSWWSGDAMGNAASNLVFNSIARNFATLRKTDQSSSTADLAAQAHQLSLSQGLEIAGRYAWENKPGQQSLAQIAKMDSAVFATHFAAVVDGKFRKQGLSLDDGTSLTFIRLGDRTITGPDGKKYTDPMMYALGMHDGKAARITLTGDDILTARNRNIAEEARLTEEAARAAMQRHGR